MIIIKFCRDETENDKMSSKNCLINYIYIKKKIRRVFQTLDFVVGFARIMKFCLYSYFPNVCI